MPAPLARDTLNAAIYRDQLAELERDRVNGLISQSDCDTARSEINRRLLDDVDGARAIEAAVPERAAKPTRRRAPTWFALLLLLPLAAASLYLQLGTPAGILDTEAQATRSMREMETAVDSLAKKLAANPDNPEGWGMLARSYGMLGRWDDAIGAFGRIGPSLDNNPNLLATFAEVRFRAAQNNFTPEVRELVAKALVADPNNLHALLLAGSDAFQSARWQKAIDYWEQLVAQLEPGSEDARDISEGMPRARAELGGKSGGKKGAHVGRRLRGGHLRRPRGDGCRSGTLARRLRHARLPDAAVAAWRAGGVCSRQRDGMSGSGDLAARHERLRQRAAMLVRLRKFFAERGFLEVETPVIDSEIIPEVHSEPFAVGCASNKQVFGFLQASPELHMKRLLCEGLPAIFQVTRSFRHGERGAIHNPEFTMVEWYRTGDDMAAGMTLLDELCQAVAGAAPATRTTYAEAFRTHVGVDAHRATCEELAAAARRLNVAVPEGIHADDRDEWLNLLLADIVEPRLGADRPEILYDYPATQSALALPAKRAGGTHVGERV